MICSADISTVFLFPLASPRDNEDAGVYKGFYAVQFPLCHRRVKTLDAKMCHPCVFLSIFKSVG